MSLTCICTIAFLSGQWPVQTWSVCLHPVPAHRRYGHYRRHMVTTRPPSTTSMTAASSPPTRPNDATAPAHTGRRETGKKREKCAISVSISCLCVYFKTSAPTICDVLAVCDSMVYIYYFVGIIFYSRWMWFCTTKHVQCGQILQQSTTTHFNICMKRMLVDLRVTHWFMILCSLPSLLGSRYTFVKWTLILATCL